MDTVLDVNLHVGPRTLSDRGNRCVARTSTTPPVGVIARQTIVRRHQERFASLVRRAHAPTLDPDDLALRDGLYEGAGEE